MVSHAVARRVVARRARIVSEPVTDYIRYELAGTAVNVHAGGNKCAGCPADEWST
ncbi:DUF6879 family protein [Streptomyces sp. NBC_00576]|uniref:DUF6879 family protein n=1 Tax=Streptomyces sp. NBC_00576 TaxID=2903665 RepID=UPI002E80CBAA|nr:DUF6879 family protein [Streptomyces sp. NBC_00576]